METFCKKNINTVTVVVYKLYRVENETILAPCESLIIKLPAPGHIFKNKMFLQ